MQGHRWNCMWFFRRNLISFNRHILMHKDFFLNKNKNSYWHSNKKNTQGAEKRNDLAFNVPVYILRKGGISPPLWLIPCKALPIFGDSVGRTSNGANEVYFSSCLWWQCGKPFRVETGKNLSHPLPGTTVGFLHSFSFWCFPLMYFFSSFHLFHSV